MPRSLSASRTPFSASLPKYELRVGHHGPADIAYEVWQLPAPASPHVKRPECVARLRGPNMDLVEHRVLRRLSRAKVRLLRQAKAPGRGYPLPENEALVLGLLFRTLAPMRSRESMRAVTEGIEAMAREEAAYWLGMAMHRKNPRRVLAALRCLLAGPRR